MAQNVTYDRIMQTAMDVADVVRDSNRRRVVSIANWANCSEQNRPALLYRNGVGLGAYMFLGFLPSYFHRSGGTFFAYTAVSDARGRLYGMDCAAGCSNCSGGDHIAPTSIVPWALRELSWPRSWSSSALPYGRDAKAQWRAVRR